MHFVFDARIHLSHITGISRYILFLLENLLKIDNHNSYTVLINGTIPENDIIFITLRQFKNVDIKKIDLPHFGPVNYTKMPSIIRKLKPSVYHYPHLDAPISGIPTVATIHDANIKEGVKKFDDFLNLKSLYFNYSLKNTLKKADQVIFISNAVKKDVLLHTKLNDSLKYNVIYNGFPQDYGEILPSAIHTVRTKFKLPEKYFLFVGQIREHKNIFRILDAFKKLNSELHLVLVGYNYDNLHFDIPHVHYLGMIEDNELKAIYAASQCFLFPSLIEGFGFPILEAYSFGIPVITSKDGATEEVAGNLSLLVNPYSVEDIKDKMNLIINGYQADSIKMKERIRNFNWKKNATQVHEIYQSLVR